MHALGQAAKREFLPGIIGTEIMVVPGHHHRVLSAYGLKVVALGEISERLAQLVQVGLVVDIGAAIAIAIDIVANHQEQVCIFFSDAHHRAGRALLFIQARAN